MGPPATHVRGRGGSALVQVVVRVPVLFFVLELVLELVVIVGALVVTYVREGARAFPEQPVVVPLLELSRFTEAARSSFSGHVVTCLEVVTAIMPCPARPGVAEREMAGGQSGRGGRCCRRGGSGRARRHPAAIPARRRRRG